MKAITYRCSLILATLSLGITAAAGATYYVDSVSGVDLNNGLSKTAPRRSLAGLRQLPIGPGDTILLKRGGLWREQWSLTVSGSTTNPISIGAYGNGGRPVITGSDIAGLSGTAWTGVYSTYLPAAPANVYVNQGDPLTPRNDLSSVIYYPGSWFYDLTSFTLYVRGGAANPQTGLVEVSTRNFGIYASGVSNVRLSNIEVRQTKLSGILVENNGSDRWTISDCVVHHVGESGISVRPGYNYGQQSLLGLVIRNNVIGRIDNAPVLDYDRAGILVRGTASATVEGNQVSTVNKIGIRVSDFHGLAASSRPTVSGNILGMNQGNISIAYTDNALVTRNTIRNSKGYGIGIGKSNDAEVSYNIIQSLTMSDDRTLYNGIDINVGSLRGNAHHNVVVGVAYFSITLEDAEGQPSNDWVIQNNIFDARTNVNPTNPGDVVGTVLILSGVSRYTFSSNNYVPHANYTSRVMRFQYTDVPFSTWMSMTGDQNSLSVDPLFSNAAAGDLTLQSGSACSGVKSGIQGAASSLLIECGLPQF